MKQRLQCGHRLNRHVGVSGRGARLTALLLGYPILQSLLAQPEGQTSTPAKGYVILLPVADAVGGFLFHGRKTVPRLLHPRLFMQQSLVLLDNVKFHHSEWATKLIEATGATVLHLPAYPPDFNPIEECISKIKETLRSLKARTKRKLYNALKKATAMVTADDIRGWFKHCGYVSSLN
jgi:transposase